MRQTHLGGEKLFVDYSGKRPIITHIETKEAKAVELFVMVWGASNFIYAEAHESQSSNHWIAAHVRAFQFFGCSPYQLVPDCLKSAVSKSHLYDPDLNNAYLDMCHHYGIALLPARPKHPKDKEKERSWCASGTTLDFSKAS